MPVVSLLVQLPLAPRRLAEKQVCENATDFKSVSNISDMKGSLVLHYQPLQLFLLLFR